MNSLGMEYGYEQRDGSRRWKGIATVIVVHAVIGWALVSGTAHDALKFIKKPLEAVVVQEVIIPPPPPPPPPKQIKPPDAPPTEAPPPFVPPPDVPPPAVSTAPTIVATAAPPPAPVVIAPPPPPAPTKNRSDIAVACPTQVQPEMPRKALQDGTTGVVRAQALISNGQVKSVEILSGPRVFHAAVRAAMMQYKCTNDGSGEVLATQEFNFKVE
jgi:periplasmic protein TonB